MKKILTVLTVLLICLTVFVSCSKKQETSVITVGASEVPHSLMLELVKEDLQKQGYELEIIVYQDYVLPNDAVQSGEILANFFQHIPYMESFNEEKNYNLVNAGGIHIEPMALYSNEYNSVSEIPTGATIAIPNDPTNEGRALLLLQSAGLITLKDSSNVTSTVEDITSNSKNLKFVEMEAAALPRVLEDVDAAVINGNYAIPAGLSAKADGIVVEGSDSPYVNIICVKEGNENNEAVKALVKALQSEKVKNWIAENYPNGEVVAAF